MRKLALCASRTAVDKALQQRILPTWEASAAPAAVAVAEEDHRARLSADHERRIQEMFKANADANAEPPHLPESRRRRDMPSADEVAARLTSSKGASCSSSPTGPDSNTGVDWREALAMLQTSDRQQVEQNMLTDTFRYVALVARTQSRFIFSLVKNLHWSLQAAAYIPEDFAH